MSGIFVIRIVLAGIISFLMTLYLVPLLIRVAFKLNILDAPDGKLKRQKAPTPYLGGVAVFVGFLSALALTFPFESQLLFLLIGLSLLIFIGLIDDLIALEPYQKFFGQMIAAFCFLRGGFYLKAAFFSATHSATISVVWLALSYLWILTVINACNLVDVMDGLATTIALGAAGSFLVMSFLFSLSLVALLLAAFCGALLAFLWFNKPPAQIYLGDAGSLFIGGFLAVIPFMFQWQTYNAYGSLTPVIILGIPLIEIAGLIVIRTAKGIPFYKGSPDHFSHYLQRKGWTSSQILPFVGWVSLILLGIAGGVVDGVLGVKALLGLGFLLVFAWITVVFIPKGWFRMR